MIGDTLYGYFSFLELLWPEGDEALSQHAVGAVENILILHAEHRPGAKGIIWEWNDYFIHDPWWNYSLFSLCVHS